MSDNAHADLKKSYDKSAEGWDQTFAAERLNTYHVRACWRAFQHAAGADFGGAAGLELGVGTGLFTDRSARRFRLMIALDFSQPMLDALQRKLDRAGVSNVEYLCASADALDTIPAQSVNGVVCFGLLEHFQDFGPLFAAVRRVLKSGGRFVGVVSNADCPWYALRQRLSGDKWYWKDVHLCTARELKATGHRTGLRENGIRGWGLIPSQLPNSALLAPVAGVERLLELSPLRRWMGGLAFRFDAP